MRASKLRLPDSTLAVTKSFFTTASSKQWGVAGDQPAPGDYDGDGKLDIAVKRSDTWYIVSGASGFTAGFTRTLRGGTMADIPVFMQ